MVGRCVDLRNVRVALGGRDAVVAEGRATVRRHQVMRVLLAEHAVHFDEAAIARMSENRRKVVVHESREVVVGRAVQVVRREMPELG